MEDFNLIDKRLDKYDFKSEENKSILFAFAPQIRGCLRKIGTKEKDVFLDALDVIGYLFKYNCIYYVNTISNYKLNYIIELINGKPFGIFNRLDKINSGKYGDKAKEKFQESYSEDNVNTVKQILKQILNDFLASKSGCK
ncbi:exported protein A EppA (plasmid) [Borreliella sinica]|uniref:exported protein A EppA n=1 Tax=Borreliella sinica TaxID=87162 RepID=UPI003AF02534